MPARLVVLISGRGSNLFAIADACDDGRLPAQVVRVVSSSPRAAGVAAARTRGLDVAVVDHRTFSDRVDFDRSIGDTIADAQPDWIVFAGFMRILGDRIIERFAGRMLNIHPSLLPKYPGLDTHARALAAGDTEHGASVHLVTAQLDAGPVIAQARVPVLPGDDTASLASRVLDVEHGLYVDALTRCLGDNVWLAGPIDRPPEPIR